MLVKVPVDDFVASRFYESLYPVLDSHSNSGVWEFCTMTKLDIELRGLPSWCNQSLKFAALLGGHGVREDTLLI